VAIGGRPGYFRSQNPIEGGGGHGQQFTVWAGSTTVDKLTRISVGRLLTHGLVIGTGHLQGCYFCFKICLSAWTLDADGTAVKKSGKDGVGDLDVTSGLEEAFYAVGLLVVGCEKMF
jgi:hypothetical protein